ncbi:bilirubin oxidase [Lacihabitans sp. CCS-44]|uniref:multicopper oxidase family protein n=1 Tax=Lacihabitans sp. CCS-44 TaxID=2487331 RepID=UPI0020CEF59E|nr:multicopper oxidase domain-containing protein [Lacihabitans sp. CCS-44]MCP9755943.1 bilirubin oxidase [Lacihabitans sp. CCS-44]
MKRIEFLKTLGLGLSAGGILSSCMGDGDVVPVSEIADFGNALKIPETIYNATSLASKSLKDTIINGKSSSYLGYGPGILGPTIRIKSGNSLNLNFKNQLSEHTNIHWHGLVIPAEMDGHPDQMVMANNSFDYKFAVNQAAGTNWYHPHIHEITGRQVTQGLAGLFIVESNEEKALNLPTESFEIPLIIQDKRFNDDGTIKYKPNMDEKMNGYMGETILVNGTFSPFLKVSSNLYRFRVLNGSSARIYNLALSNAASFYIIGSDGGILEKPEVVSSVLLSSGERLDILIDFSKVPLNSEIFLESNQFSGMGTAQGTQKFKILKFIVNKQGESNFKVPLSLIPIQKLSGSTQNRNFSLKMKMLSLNGGMHRINNKVYKSGRIDETVSLGATETWEFDNSTGDEPHPMHIHGVHFQVVARSGGRNEIQPHEKGWKDTVLVAPKEKVQVIIKFTQKGKFVFHCHNLEHEDDGMMLNFEVK